MFKEQIIDLLKENIASEFASLVEVFPPQNSAFGDFSTNIAMKLARLLKKNPEIIAEGLKAKLHLPGIAKIEVVKPGYLNFYLDEKIYRENLKEILGKKEQYGQGQTEKGRKIMIEFAHPNPFKIMHIGHLRNISLGESLVRLFEFQGAKVIRTNYQGDVATCMPTSPW